MMAWWRNYKKIASRYQVVITWMGKISRHNQPPRSTQPSIHPR